MIVCAHNEFNTPLPEKRGFCSVHRQFSTGLNFLLSIFVDCDDEFATEKTVVSTIEKSKSSRRCSTISKSETEREWTNKRWCSTIKSRRLRKLPKVPDWERSKEAPRAAGPDAKSLDVEKIE